MTIAYENKNDDAVAWCEFYLTRTPAGKKAYRKSLIQGALLYGVVPTFVAALWIQPKGMGWLILAAIAAVMFAYAYFHYKEFAVPKRAAKRMIRQKQFQKFFGKREVIVHPEGMRWVVAAGEVLKKWQSGQYVEETESYLYLFWASDDFVQIPKKAFPTPEEQHAFQAEVEQYIRRAQSVSPVSGESHTTSGSRNWWQDRNNVDTGTNSQEINRLR